MTSLISDLNVNMTTGLPGFDMNATTQGLEPSINLTAGLLDLGSNLGTEILQNLDSGIPELFSAENITDLIVSGLNRTADIFLPSYNQSDRSLNNVSVSNRDDIITVSKEIFNANTTDFKEVCQHFFAYNREPNVRPDIAYVKWVCFQVILPSIIVLGTVGNAINLVVLRGFSGRTFSYLYWLALSDFVAMLFDIVLLMTFNGAATNQIGAMFFCHGILPAAGTMITNSNFIIVILTIERFQAVRYPLKARQKQINPKWPILICFLVAVTVFYPLALMYEVKAQGFEANGITSIACYKCHTRVWPSHLRLFVKLYYIFLLAGSKLIPVLVVTFFNAFTIISLNYHQRERAVSLNKPPGLSELAEDRLKLLIMTITTVFIICMSPLVVQELFFVKYQINITYEIFKDTALLLVHLNTACNFYVYCFCSAAVRLRIQQLYETTIPGVLRRTKTPTSPATPSSPNTGISMVSLNADFSNATPKISQQSDPNQL